MTQPIDTTGLDAAYNAFLAALGTLADAVGTAAIDPDVALALEEIGTSTYNIIVSGINIGTCILGYLP